MSRLLVLLLPVAVLVAEGGGGPGSSRPAPVNPGPDGQPVPPGGGGGMEWLIWLFPLGLLFFLLWSSSRAQKKEQRQHQELLDSLSIGDDVVTIGGMHGEIVKKGEETLDIRVGGSSGPIITFTRTAVRGKAGDPTAATKA